VRTAEEPASLGDIIGVCFALFGGGAISLEPSAARPVSATDADERLCETTTAVELGDLKAEEEDQPPPGAAPPCEVRRHG
jgi:hypothetical protein